MKRGHRVAGEATVRCTPLRAGWTRGPRDYQRDRSETLHGDILRLFGIGGWLVRVGDKADARVALQQMERSRQKQSGPSDELEPGPEHASPQATSFC
jgi:hypothetical protein